MKGGVSDEDAAAGGKVARRWLATGLVQGVGFRPTVARIAESLGLTGSVENTTAGVVIVLEGDAESLERFTRRLRAELPARARVGSLTVETLAPAGAREFVIRGESAARREGERAPLSARVPPDARVCSACLGEVSSNDKRRGRYEFVSCVDCGPRYSIIIEMPFERRDTSMRDFAPCADCQREYGDANDRRFHAQTNACRRCGPAVSWNSTRVLESSAANTIDPLETARETLRRGGIVALQGLGGWQLLVDATNQQAVARLRDRKRRPAKPLAVLVPDLAAADDLAQLTPGMRQLLSGPEGPIVLATARSGSPLAANIHLGLDEVGLLLPTTPLHARLISGLGPLVATSGNGDGDPLEFDASPDLLREVADVLVSHDREIVRPVDDSVIRWIADRPTTVRLARGLAPLPLSLPLPIETSSPGETGGVVALGGHQKAAFALHNGVQAVLGPHIGDLDQETTRQRYLDQLRGFIALYGARIHTIVHDAHPDYFTTQLAQDWTSRMSCPSPPGAGEIRRIAVQHHHAHVVSAMIEHQLLERTVLGFAWDGTGWGPDGTIWGGELLVADRRRCRRVARLRPFALAGGEQAVRQPWRVALSVAAAALEDMDEALRVLGQVAPALGQHSRGVASLLASNTACVWTSSMGRLFDAVATLVLPGEWTQGGVAAFEGQLAMSLESACARHLDDVAYSRSDLRLQATPSSDGVREWDWRPLVRELIDLRRRGAEPGELATLFHEALSDAVWEAAGEFPELPVVLGGGVFQNKALVERIASRFDAGQRWLGLPGVIPPNDGGLAAGQLAIGAAVDLASDPRTSIIVE